MKFTSSPIYALRRSCLSLRTLSPVILLQAAMFAVNARARESSEIVSIAPPALAFARYIAFLNQRSPFTESGSVRVKIDASLPGFGKQACMSAVRDTGASERGEDYVLQIEGDPMVKREVIARYLSAQTQAEGLPLSSTLITPANYKFRYSGSLQSLGTVLYVFQITPRRRRAGLIQGQIWIDSVTGVAVHEVGHFVKTPSVFLRQIDVTRDTTLRDGLPDVRITHTAVETRRRAIRAELTITEQPLRAPDEGVTIRTNPRYPPFAPLDCGADCAPRIQELAGDISSTNRKCRTFKRGTHRLEEPGWTMLHWSSARVCQPPSRCKSIMWLPGIVRNAAKPFKARVIIDPRSEALMELFRCAYVA